MSLAQEFNLNIPSSLLDNDRIIVADSQQDMRMIIVHQLQKLQFKQIIQCRDGMEVLNELKKQDVAAIICTMDLPDMDGLELLSEIREDVDINRPPFCLSMGQVSKERLMLAVETGVDEILVKPFTLGDIVPKLRKSFKTFHNPKNPEKVYELAKEKLRSQSADEAEKIYTRLRESAPNTARPLVGLAKVSFAKKEYEQAFKLLESAQEKNDQYVHIFSLRGDIYLEQGDYDQGIAAYRHGIGMSPLNPNRYKKAGEALFGQSRYQEAADILKGALTKKVHFKELYDFLSQACYNLKDYESSAKYIRRAVEKEPDNITYLNQLALSLKECGELDEAKKFYNKVIKLDPDNKQALFNKAIMLAQSEKEQDAIKILDRLVKKYPDFEKGIKKIEELKAKLAEGGA
ncbi:MAG: tetratricopeptide repeat protein [Oligoflexales bacterium]